MRTFKSTLMALALVVLPAFLTPAIAIAATEADTKVIEATYYAAYGKAIDSQSLDFYSAFDATRIPAIQAAILKDSPLMKGLNEEQVIAAIYTNLMGTPPQGFVLNNFANRLRSGELTLSGVLNSMLAYNAPSPARFALFAATTVTATAPAAASPAPATTTKAEQPLAEGEYAQQELSKLSGLLSGQGGSNTTSQSLTREEFLQKVNAMLDSAEDLKIEEEDNTPSYQKAKASLGGQAVPAAAIYSNLVTLKQSLQSSTDGGIPIILPSGLEKLQLAITVWQNAMGTPQANTAATNTALTNQAIGTVNAVNDAVVRDVLSNTAPTPKCHLEAIPHTYPPAYQTVCN